MIDTNAFLTLDTQKLREERSKGRDLENKLSHLKTNKSISNQQRQNDCAKISEPRSDTLEVSLVKIHTCAGVAAW